MSPLRSINRQVRKPDHNPLFPSKMANEIDKAFVRLGTDNLGFDVLKGQTWDNRCVMLKPDENMRHICGMEFRILFYYSFKGSVIVVDVRHRDEEFSGWKKMFGILETRIGAAPIPAKVFPYVLWKGDPGYD